MEVAKYWTTLNLTMRLSQEIRVKNYVFQNRLFLKLDSHKMR